jgi:transposase InsO family protein
MKYQFIAECRSTFPVKKMCQILDVSRSGYYEWEQREPSQRKKDNKMLLDQIKEIHRKSRNRYGSPRITHELRKNGVNCSKNRVASLMRKNYIQAKAKKKFKATTNSKHNYPVAVNLLNQQFQADYPNQVWASDITYVWTSEGWLYLAAILDIWSRKIVGWAMSNRQTKELVVQALKQAIGRRSIESGIIHHSDRGSQYASNEYKKVLNKYGFKQSMSKKGDCYDNAIMETFFHTLKTELIYWEHYKTRDDARRSIFEYIEIFYNRERLHSSLEYNSPEEYEQFNKVA